jgi:hypothetical protein
MLPMLFGLVACAPSSPYPSGLAFSLKSRIEQTTTSYRMTDGGEPINSIGLLGIGDTLLVAQSSAGTRTTSSSVQLQYLSQVVGTTPVSHPLVPNSEEFGPLLASVVQEKVRSAAYTVVEESFYDPTSAFPQYDVVSYLDEQVLTYASYYGVAADEYVVRFDLGTLWSNFEEEVSASDVLLLTRNDPSMGDVWSSANGNTLYVYSGEENVTIGGQPRTANKVLLYEAANLQSNGADVYDQCLRFGYEQQSTNSADLNQYSNGLAYLDPGCEGSFSHVQTGTQWWYSGILVKEETAEQIVDILDYGYEWYEDQEDGTVQRMRTQSMTDASVISTKFIEYELTEVSTLKGVTEWREP